MNCGNCGWDRGLANEMNELFKLGEFAVILKKVRRLQEGKKPRGCGSELCRLVSDSVDKMQFRLVDGFAQKFRSIA